MTNKYEYEQSLCNKNFETQYVYINDNPIHILDYLKLDDNISHELKCLKGHNLCCVNGTSRKPYFRHVNSSDISNNLMSIWHAEWQGNFPSIEITYPKQFDNQIKERRADAVIDSHKLIVEFQHSKIDAIEVKNRNHDYALYGMSVIWIIDGNYTIDVKELSHSSRVYLEFKSDVWKYESFVNKDNSNNQQAIYINIGEQIYKIFPDKIKSHMIDVQMPKSKDECIKSLMDGTFLELWEKDEPFQSRMYFKQQGAGNGKTYGIIQMLENETFKHYDDFIIVTKQHSAKLVIKEEFISQYKNGMLNNITLIDEPQELNKKIIIRYINQFTNNACNLIIATVDSLMYAIGDSKCNAIEKFEGIVNSIIDGHIEATSNGSIKFSSLNPKLNKQTLLVIDETQDLTENYAHAFLRIMRDRYVDCYIVGDKLQSISFEKNAFVYLTEAVFSYVDKKQEPATNVCRRFYHPKLVEFVNEMVPFEKYNLLPIQPYKIMDNEEALQNNNSSPLVIFDGQPVYQQIEKNVKKNIEEHEMIINIEIGKIMNLFNCEVNNFNRRPEDFLIVTPFTTQNALIESLQIAIDIYWEQKIKDDETYRNNVLFKDPDNYWINNNDINVFYRFAVFHKSEEGTSINLNESKYATRIVSGHSSKGDGRPVVFVIGFTEQSLKRFSGTTDTLIYDSLFHVAITRMKEKLYIRYENNNDDISQKINKYNYSHDASAIILNKPILHHYTSVKYKEIVQYIKNTNNIINVNGNTKYDDILHRIINMNKQIELENGDNEKIIIDMQNHNIRHACMYITLLIEIVKNERSHNNDVKKQIQAKMHQVSEAIVMTSDNWREYNRHLINNNSESCCKFVPILKISKGRDDTKYYNIIYEFMHSVQDKITIFIKKNKHISLCPLECIILYYMIQIVNEGQYSNIYINEVYNIVNMYSKCFNSTLEGHDNCKCKNYFSENNETIVDNKLYNYLFNHYEKIKEINPILNSIYTKYPDINWLTEFTIRYTGKTDYFKMSKQFTFIGWNDENVIICYIKPQFNALNYNEILMNSIFDTYLIQNDKEHKQTFGKKIIACVITLDMQEPYYFNWNGLMDDANECVKSHVYDFITDKYKLHNKCFYNFYMHWINNVPSNVKHPSDIIEFIKDKYISLSDELSDYLKFTPYFMDFLNKIKYLIDDAKMNMEQKTIFRNYKTKEYFIDDINATLDYAVKKYLNIENKQIDTNDDIWDDL